MFNQATKVITDVFNDSDSDDEPIHSPDPLPPPTLLNTLWRALSCIIYGNTCSCEIHVGL